MKQLFTLKGYWNGEPTATFTACIIKPKENTEKPMYWYNVFSGKERQAIEITYAGQTWIIDNNVGDGYLKVTKGQGSPSYGHKSLDNYDFVRYIPESELNIVYDRMLADEEQQEINEYQKMNYPEAFEQHQRLLKSLTDYQKMSLPEKIDHINKKMTPKK
jgi:hypothetical protein